MNFVLVIRLLRPYSRQDRREDDGALVPIHILLLQSVVIVALLVHAYRRRRVEEALREREHRYQVAMDLGVCIWDWNVETNEVCVGATLRSKLGIEHGDVGNRPEDWWARVYPQDVSATKACVNACIKGEADGYAIEHRLLHRDGSVLWFLSRAAALRRADGTLRHLVGTSLDITELKHAQESSAEAVIALRNGHDEIQRLAESLIAAQDAERARVARELHDGVSQELAALSIALSSLQRRFETMGEGAVPRAEWSAIHRRTEALAQSIRSLSHDFHPDAHASGGLSVALAARCAEISEAQRIAVTFTSDENLDTLDSETTRCLYRVTQEALTNVVRHARARSCQVLLYHRGDRAELTVADDGVGFDLPQSRRGKGLGLISINERVRLAGGTLTVITERGRGTKLQVNLPTGARAFPPAGDRSGNTLRPDLSA